VRDYLRRIDREADWTEMQGYVYGARMAEANAFPGVLEFMRNGRNLGWELYIVSHKTRYAVRGRQYNLHRAAREWVTAHLNDERGALIGEGDLFFELTTEAKIARVNDLGSHYLIDDLPELLRSAQLPKHIRRILFDPEGTHADDGILIPFTNWSAIGKYIAANID
jgi:hypothetical protein